MSEKNETSSGVGGVPSGSRSEYGDIIPIRPRPTTPPTRCLRGHRLDLGGMTITYHHLYRLHGILCEICRIVEHHDPPAPALAEWSYVDTSVRYSAAAAPDFGLVLVVDPPSSPGGTGYVHFRLDGSVIATIDVVLCGSCRRGTVQSVRVEQRYRRLGYARTLVAAALTLQPRYTWVAKSDSGTVASKAFWTTTGLPKLRPEDRCPHVA
jgi:GNAT superfamily N-acetyltransferase